MTDHADEYDVVVLGSGIGGLSAALAACEVGLSPIVLEKADLLGGGTSWSYGLIWVGLNHLAENEGYGDDAEEVIRYARFLGGGECDEDRFQAFYCHAPEMLRFYERAGIEFRLVRGLTDHYYGTAPGARKEGRSLEAALISGRALGEFQDKILLPRTDPWFVSAEEQIAWGGMNRVAEWDQDLIRERKAADTRGMGVALVCQFVAALQARGAPILTQAVAAGLCRTNGRVSGVQLANGNEIRARKGVVIATGGYEANPRMVENFERMPGWQSQFPESITGDGIVMAQEIGAAIRYVPNNMQLFLSIRIPGAGSETATTRLAGIVELCSPHTLVANRHGRRFADESYFQGMVPALRAFDVARHEYANLPCFLIFDANYAENYSFAGVPAGQWIPSWVSRAQSIPELASGLGVDADGLARTVRRFNEFANTGKDLDFNRGEASWQLVRGAVSEGQNTSLGEIAKAPFFGVQLYPTGAGAAGLLADDRARVIDVRGRPVDGLYAIGNAAAHTEYGTGYQAGLSLASSMTFSYLAAHHMAGTPLAHPILE